jgi:hypothetical protein
MTIGILASGAYIPRLRLARRVIADTHSWLNPALKGQGKGERGAIRDVLDGFYDADGTVPCQIDGGLKCFGRPIGASGLRMIYEMYLQLQGWAGERQRKEAPKIAACPITLAASRLRMSARSRLLAHDS